MLNGTLLTRNSAPFASSLNVLPDGVVTYTLVCHRDTNRQSIASNLSLAHASVSHAARLQLLTLAACPARLLAASERERTVEQAPGRSGRPRRSRFSVPCVASFELSAAALLALVTPHILSGWQLVRRASSADSLRKISQGRSAKDPVPPASIAPRRPRIRYRAAPARSVRSGARQRRIACRELSLWQPSCIPAMVASRALLVVGVLRDPRRLYSALEVATPLLTEAPFAPPVLRERMQMRRG